VARSTACHAPFPLIASWSNVCFRARYIERAKPEAGEKAFKSSWIATYQRVGCEWKMTGNASAVVCE
jgi:hypothetical protein